MVEPVPDTFDSAPPTPSISPCFIVSDVETSISFYVDKLGFSVEYAEPPESPFFAIVRRDGAMIFLKAEAGIEPVPNNRRHRHLRLDAYVSSPDPDALYEDFSQRGVPFSKPLCDTHDGLRGFEVTDPDGLVLFFGRPR
jgi:catechol 2,3-dioxygenase-like lactoylglutathione lyase family enzyme